MTTNVRTGDSLRTLVATDVRGVLPGAGAASGPETADALVAQLILDASNLVSAHIEDDFYWTLNGTAVAQCDDGVGSKDASQGTEAAQPEKRDSTGPGSRDEADFDGSDDFLSASGYSIAEGSMAAMWAVANLDDATPSVRHVIMSLTWGSVTFGMKIRGDDGGDIEIVGRDNDGPDQTYVFAYGAIDTDSHIYRHKASAAGFITTIDGVDKTASAATSGMGTNGSGPVSLHNIASASNSASNVAECRVSATLVFDSAFGAGEEAAAASTLGTYFGGLT